MKDYIEKNIHKYKITKVNEDKFRIMYYKLKNSAVFAWQTDKKCSQVYENKDISNRRG